MEIPSYIKALTSYKPGKPIEETKREFGLTEVIKLASNENPLGPSPKVLASIKEGLSSQHIYPDPSQFDLIQAGARHWNVNPANLVFGNGTDEMIDLLVRLFCHNTISHMRDSNHADAVLTSQYAFQAYDVTAQACRVNFLAVPSAKDWKFDLDAIVKKYEENKTTVKIIFIANPNNPTGTYLSEGELSRFLKHFEGNNKVLIVFDEAYAEFVRANDYQSQISKVMKYSNIAVLRTFSKIYGVAGLRLGALIASPEVIDAVNRIRKPFNVSGVAQIAGVAAMQDFEFLKKTQELTWSGIDFFYKELAAMNLPFVRSEGNFILFDTKQKADGVFQSLLKKGIILRPVGNYGLPNHLRMSVGLDSENKKAIQAIKEIGL